MPFRKKYKTWKRSNQYTKFGSIKRENRGGKDLVFRFMEDMDMVRKHTFTE